jgi:hypothetical protein
VSADSELSATAHLDLISSRSYSPHSEDLEFTEMISFFSMGRWQWTGAPRMTPHTDAGY